MTEVMEKSERKTGRVDWAESVRQGEEWKVMVQDTYLNIIRSAANDGGVCYDDVLYEAQRRLADRYVELNHSQDFFDNILNQMSISRRIDSGRSDRLFVDGEQPWLDTSRRIGTAAVRFTG